MNIDRLLIQVFPYWPHIAAIAFIWGLVWMLYR